MTNKIFALALVVALTLLLSCSKQPAKPKVTWYKDLPKLGTNSSPRCADLNGDGVLDVVLGAGRNEFIPSEYGVVALDGIDGEIIWSVPGQDQMVGSATFLDVTSDGIPEVFIGGRSAQLFCIDGKKGEMIWQYKVLSDALSAEGMIRFNFYNPQVVDDQNGDGRPDILVANGGNVKAAAGSEFQRFPGVLALFSGVDGTLLAADTMPDGKETYMSPVVHNFGGGGVVSIVFGTGGETVGGSLYKADLSDLLSGDLSGAQRLLSEQTHGFFAPPVISDLTEDGTADIVVNWHGGKMIAVDGETDEVLWSNTFPEVEVSNMVTPGFFNEDDVPDFFSYYSKGVWPENTGGLQVAVDGRNGAILFRDSIGCSGFSSAVAYDIDSDGFDEIVGSVNDYDCTAAFTGAVKHMLMLYDINDQSTEAFSGPLPAKNISSTPWLGDLDGDQKLDIVLCLQANVTRMHEFYGIQIQRLQTVITEVQAPAWGSYMGHRGKSEFNTNEQRSLRIR